MTTSTAPGADLGGCDGRYLAADCVWGNEPDPLVQQLHSAGLVTGRRLLDAGCGDGRNAAWLAAAGAEVVATDVSALALESARRNHPEAAVDWWLADLREQPLGPDSFDGVVMSSVLHWLLDEAQVAAALAGTVVAVRPAGWLALTVFTSRHAYTRTATDTRLPCLLPHEWYLRQLERPGWRLRLQDDTDLAHGHTGHEEPHVHAVSRFLAVRDAGS